MDYIIRASAADGQIRAFAATTREIAETARETQQSSPVVTAALGRLLCGGVMMGSMMKGEKDLLTLRITGDGPVASLLVTADSNGHVKGYAANPRALLPARSDGKLDVAGAVGKGMLQVIRDFGLKEPYVGSAALQTGEIAEDLTYYFATSEQVPSSVGLGVLMNRDNTVRRAGGFIIQLMPYTTEEVIAGLEKKLTKIASVTDMLEDGMTPEDILQEILGEFHPEILEKMPVSYRCDCSKERYRRALISLGKKELRSLIEEGRSVETVCQFCQKKYVFTVDELNELLDSAVR